MVDTPVPAAPAPTELPSGVKQEGATTSFTPVEGEPLAVDPNAPAKEAPASDRPAEWPEGVDSWEAFGKLTPEERVKAISAANAPAADETKIETKGTENEPAKEGIDLLLEGASDEMKAGLTPLVAAFSETGDLTEAQIAEAVKVTGLPKGIVQQYVDNAKVAQAGVDGKVIADFQAAAGGADNYASFQEWANEALGPDDHAKINEAVAKGDPAGIASFVDAWKASGRAPAPRDLTTESRQASPGATAENQGYATQAEQNKAINDPRYRSDPDYRKSVEDKIKRTNFE